MSDLTQYIAIEKGINRPALETILSDLPAQTQREITEGYGAGSITEAGKKLVELSRPLIADYFTVYFYNKPAWLGSVLSDRYVYVVASNYAQKFPKLFLFSTRALLIEMCGKHGWLYGTIPDYYPANRRWAERLGVKYAGEEKRPSGAVWSTVTINMPDALKAMSGQKRGRQNGD